MSDTPENTPRDPQQQPPRNDWEKFRDSWREERKKEQKTSGQKNRSKSKGAAKAAGATAASKATGGKVKGNPLSTTTPEGVSKKRALASDAGSVAKGAAKGAVKGSAGGMVGAGLGAAKGAGSSALRTKTGRKVLGLVLLMALAMPVLFGGGAMAGVQAAGLLFSISSTSKSDVASQESAKKAGVSEENLENYRSSSGANSSSWEVLSGMEALHASEGTDGEGDLGIRRNVAQCLVDDLEAGLDVDKIDLEQYAEVEEPVEYTDENGEDKERDWEYGTDPCPQVVANPIPEAERDEVLGPLSKEDAEDPRMAAEWMGKLIYFMTSRSDAVKDLPDTRFDAAVVSGLDPETSNLDEPSEEQKAKAAQAKQHREVFTDLFSKMPVGGMPGQASTLYEHVRIIALGGTMDQCSANGGMGGGDVVANGEWVNPLKINGEITSGFGPRPQVAGVAIDTTFHNGSDLTNGKNEPYVSASGGKVITKFGAGSPDGPGDGGNGIIVDAGNNVHLWYWHSVEGSAKVSKGDSVEPGQELATVGTTGNSSGIHLHFEVQVNGEPVDPVTFMKQRGVDLGQDEMGKASNPQGEAGSEDAGQDEASEGEESSAEDESGGESADESSEESGDESESAEDSAGPESTGDLYYTDAGSGAKHKLEPRQIEYVNQIKGTAKERVSDKDKADRLAVLSIMAALQESHIRVLANPTYPETMDMDKDGVGSDHDSVGIFQQRPQSGWGEPKQLMDSQYNIDAFIGGDKGPNKGSPRGVLDTEWESGPLGQVVQTVQGSAFPDAYDQWEEDAKRMVGQVDGTYVPSAHDEDCADTGGSSESGGSEDSGSDSGEASEANFEEFDDEKISATRKKILEGAKDHIGTPYVWGGTDPDSGWDCSGYVWWTYKNAGKDLGRTTADGYAHMGKETSTPKPGDVIVQNYQGGGYQHIAIYAGDQGWKAVRLPRTQPPRRYEALRARCSVRRGRQVREPAGRLR